jgi:hypothetical protein
MRAGSHLLFGYPYAVPMAREALPDGPLFAYGTLRFPGILDALLGRVPDHTPAVVQGWRVAALDGRVYPVLVPGTGAASGILLTGLSAAEWRIIDVYEDDFYGLEPLSLVDGRVGWAYVTRDATGCLPGDWSPDDFAARHLAAFTRECVTWRGALEF